MGKQFSGLFSKEKCSPKIKKLLNKQNIKAALEWLAIISTIAVNIYSIIKK